MWFSRTALILLVASLFGASCKRVGNLDHRVANMKSLLNLFSADRFTNAEISQLLLEADHRGVKLHPLKVRDAKKQCYRFVFPTSSDPTSVVLEETENVDDATFVVRGYLDGSTAIERK